MNFIWIKAALKRGFKIAIRHIIAILLASLTTALAILGLYFKFSSESSFQAKKAQLLATPILLSFSSDISKQKLQSAIDEYKLTPQAVEMEGAAWLEIKIEALKLIPNPAFNFVRRDICKELERLEGVIYVDCAADFVEHKIKAFEGLFYSVRAVSYTALFLGFLLTIAILKLAFEGEKIFDALELCGASRLQRWTIFIPSLAIIDAVSFGLWFGLVTSISNLTGSLFELRLANSAELLNPLTFTQIVAWLAVTSLFLVIASLFLKTRRALTLLIFFLVVSPFQVHADVIEFLEAQLNVVEAQLQAFNKDLMTFEASFSNQKDLINALAQRSEVISKELYDTRLKLYFINALVNATPYRLESETERLERFVLISQKLALEKKLAQLETERDFIEQKIVETEMAVLQPMKIEKTLLDHLSSLQKQYNLFESALGKVALQPEKSWSPDELGITIESCKGFLPWPVKGSVLKGFAPNKNPPHMGITIASEPCKEVRSIYWGSAKFVGTLGTAQSIILEHGSGYFSIYSGLEEVYVEIGDEVQPYSPIGKLSCEQPLLTFELQKSKEAVNPLEWLSISTFFKP